MNTEERAKRIVRHQSRIIQEQKELIEILSEHIRILKEKEVLREDIRELMKKSDVNKINSGEEMRR